MLGGKAKTSAEVMQRRIMLSQSGIGLPEIITCNEISGAMRHHRAQYRYRFIAQPADVENGAGVGEKNAITGHRSTLCYQQSCYLCLSVLKGEQSSYFHFRGIIV